MGFYLSLAAVSDATIDRLVADPPLVMQIMVPDDPNAVASARERPPGPGLFGRLLGRKAPPPPPEPPPLALQPGEGDLGPDGDSRKVLARDSTTSSRAPPGRATRRSTSSWRGGAELDIELGMAPPRAYSVAETRVIAARARPGGRRRAATAVLARRDDAAGDLSRGLGGSRRGSTSCSRSMTRLRAALERVTGTEIWAVGDDQLRPRRGVPF